MCSENHIFLSSGHRAAALCTILVVALCSTSLLADDGVLDEVIATAERHPENLQKTPLTVMVVSGAELDASGVESTLDLQLRVPGFVFSTNTVLGQPYIRGIGSDLISAGAEASVATFVDGVYQTRAALALQDFFDVERIEVIKGPQGTLYGRNSTGGAIAIITKDPAEELALESDLLIGRFTKIRLRSMVNAPVLKDKVFLRMAALATRRDGYTKNLYLDQKVDGEQFWALRGKLRIDASDHLRILISADYGSEDSTRALSAKIGQPFGGSPGVIFGGSVPLDEREVLSDVDSFADVEAWGLSARVTWDMGAVTLRSLSAWRESRFLELLDLDATELPLATNEPQEISKTFSQELQLSPSNTSAFQWVAGAFYLREDATQSLDVKVDFPIGPPFPIRDRPSGIIDVDAFAVFGQASYRFAGWLSLTAGLRYSNERKRQQFLQITDTAFGQFVAEADEARRWDAVTPKFRIEIFPDENLMLYVLASKGFKSGGFNSNQFQPPFDPEKLWSFEAGFKWTFLDERIRTNISAFHYDYKDLQVNVLAPNAPLGAFPNVENAAVATIEGIDAQISLSPMTGLLISADLSLLYAEFDEFVAVDPNNRLAPTDQAGNRLPRAPKLTWNLVVQYETAVANLGTMRARVGYRRQSTIFFNPFEDPFSKQSAYSIWNARIELESHDERWSVAIFGRNLGGTLYAQNKIRVDGQVGNLIFWGAPRTIGVQISYRY